MLFPTPPLSIVDIRPAPTHYRRGRGGYKPRFTVIHHTAGTDSRDWLSTTSSPAVSAHRLISKDGTIYKIVPDEHTAYTAGFAVVGPVDPDANDPPGVPPNFNLISLNLELENRGTGRDPYPDTQLDAAAAQVVEWMGKYGFLAIVGHSWVDGRKHDPAGFDWADFYRRIDLRYWAVRSMVVR